MAHESIDELLISIKLISGVARVAEPGGQARGKGLHQGGMRTCETRSAVDISPLSAKQCSQ